MPNASSLQVSTKHLVKERLQVKATPSFYFFRRGELLDTRKGTNEDFFRDVLLRNMTEGEKE